MIFKIKLDVNTQHKLKLKDLEIKQVQERWLIEI